MSREEQIKNMARAIHLNCHKGLTSTEAEMIAKWCYQEIDRKASKVAEELINTALSKIQIMISAIKAQEENGTTTEFNSGAKTALKIVLKDLAELKKKCTESEGEKDAIT